MTRRLRTRLRGEAGITLVEVMITLSISLVLIAAMAQFFVLANRSSLSSRRQISALGLAQQQIEAIRHKVKQFGFSSLAMKTIPAKAGADTDPSNPTDFITASGTSFEIQENFDVPGTLLATEPLLQSAGGFVDAVQTLVPAGSATATVYTFVTQVTDVCQAGLANGASLCTSAPAGSDGGATASTDTDVRRVVVAVKLNATGGRTDAGPNTPQYLSTVITNPVPSNQVNNVNGLRIGLQVS